MNEANEYAKRADRLFFIFFITCSIILFFISFNYFYSFLWTWLSIFISLAIGVICGLAISILTSKIYLDTKLSVYSEKKLRDIGISKEKFEKIKNHPEYIKDIEQITTDKVDIDNWKSEQSKRIEEWRNDLTVEWEGNIDVEFKYSNIQDEYEKPLRRKVTVTKLFEEGYIYGFCHLRNEMRHFNIVKIESKIRVLESGKQYSPPDFMDMLWLSKKQYP